MRPLRVALTGGIGAGKSEALAAFARRGAAVASADEIVHRLLRDDAELRAAIRDELGVDPGEGGAEGRAALAEAVFGDPERLARLEALLHPRVVREQAAWLEGVDAELAVIEIPLLYETGAEERFDAVVAITAPPALRAERKRLSRLEERERRLLPEEEKARRADFAYVNDGSLDDLDRFVEGVVTALRETAVA